jgi:hypothetical protein
MNMKMGDKILKFIKARNPLEIMGFLIILVVWGMLIVSRISGTSSNIFEIDSTSNVSVKSTDSKCNYIISHSKKLTTIKNKLINHSVNLGMNNAKTLGGRYFIVTYTDESKKSKSFDLYQTKHGWTIKLNSNIGGTKVESRKNGYVKYLSNNELGIFISNLCD